MGRGTSLTVRNLTASTTACFAAHSVLSPLTVNCTYYHHAMLCQGENLALMSVKTNKKAPNGVLGIETSCTGENLTVTVDMERKFHGAIHAKGFPIECRAVGQGDKFVQLTVAASSCGLRITPHKDGGLMYHLVVEAQTTRHLQQATDMSLAVSCHLPRDQIVLHSPAINSLEHKRSGRNMHEDNESVTNTDDHDGTAKAWLEIQGSGDSEVKSVIVGERTTLRLKAWLPDGVDSRVVDCMAHDGAGESSQLLVDGEGCPVDRLLVPAFEQTVTQATDKSGLILHQHSTSFPAFKFPDRSALHIRCGLMVCSQACSLLECSGSKEEDSSRSDRKLKEVLDRVQLFNSIEVVAPGIETDALTRINHLRRQSGEKGWELGEGEQPLCIAATKTAAVWLACAGVMFMMALLASLCVLIRGRMRRTQLTDERNKLLFVPPFVW
ncbi:hypothetical protein LSTR_LSTR005613 [Laodelphax striatellus]|uniref:ZP domain-containing protein n=1 Tax=Laodelphax striatellus TaxID=195883 RepID=A0A482WVV9_LAOST|nr:hypothetical protein LSTR_LSTR005613 [Laodelphax striatellus]